MRRLFATILAIHMHERFGGALRIDLTETGATLVRRNWLRSQGEVIAESVLDGDDTTPAAVVNRLGALLKEAGCARLPTSVTLADSWVRCWMVTPPQNAASLADCRAAAEARFYALFGETMAAWHLEADWDARRPFLACAIPADLLASLRKIADDSGLRLTGIAPGFISSWNRWRKRLPAGAWLLVLHARGMTCLAASEDRLQNVRTIRADDAAAIEPLALRNIVEREALRLNLPPPREVWLRGWAPLGWTSRSMGGMNFVVLPQDDAEPAAAGRRPVWTGMRT